MMHSVHFETVENPDPTALAILDRGLHEFNLAHLGASVIENYAKVAVLARDAQEQIIGGIYGELLWDWLHIDTLWVAEAHRGRGIGTDLLRRIEQRAVARGFLHSHLETTEFQAIDFYRKQGYQIFGQLDGKPAGHTWYYIKKDLV